MSLNDCYLRMIVYMEYTLGCIMTSPRELEVKILDAIPCSRAAEPHGQSESRDKGSPRDLGARFRQLRTLYFRKTTTMSEFCALFVSSHNYVIMPQQNTLTLERQRIMKVKVEAAGRCPGYQSAFP